MARKLRLSFDFDGVLAQYDGWKGPFVLGDPMPGIKELLEDIIAKDMEYIVITTRPITKAVEGWFSKHGLPEPKIITNKKIPAHIYIDDRGMQFDGSVKNLKENIKNFQLHWKKGKPFKEL